MNRSSSTVTNQKNRKTTTGSPVGFPSTLNFVLQFSPRITARIHRWRNILLPGSLSEHERFKSITVRYRETMGFVFRT